MRRALALALPLLALACSRDLDLPASSPPRIDTVAVVGLEPQAVPSELHVLGGELVAIHGGGFASDPAEVEVRIGSEDAEVLDAHPDRIVARVPTLAAFGPADLQVRTASGFRTQEGAFRYDGPGQPLGFGTSDVDTSVDLGFVAPVQPPSARGFSDLAVATGASDAALLVVPAVGLAVATIPLGMVPSAAAAWMDAVTVGTIVDVPRLNVLAVARGGDAALGTAVLDGSSIRTRAEVDPLFVDTDARSGGCALPQVIATYGAPLAAPPPIPVAAWEDAAGQQKIAAIDVAAARNGRYAPASGASGVHDVAARITGWGPWGASSVVFAAGTEVYAYDAAAPAAPPAVLRVAKGGVLPPVPVTGLLRPAGCPAPIEFVYTVATATTGTSDALAIAYRAGGVDRIALVDLGPGPSVGTVRSGIAGTIPTSLSLVPDPPYAAPTAWSVLAAGGTTLFRFRPLGDAPPCGDLVADAAIALSDGTGFLPTFGGMTPAADGTRLLTTTPDRDLVTVLPPSLTSAGPIVRFASYGGVSIQRATIGGTVLPVAIAEHATFDSSVSDLDTGSALLLLSLGGDAGALAIGGSGYGRGAVWLERSGGKGALAYTGDLRKTAAIGFLRGGAASVTGFAAGQCPGETVRIDASRPIAGGPDLVFQGPARSGALGPEGIARFGPAAPPVYSVKNRALHVYDADAATLACLAGEVGAPDWNPLDGTCAAAVVALGVDPLDVTLSAGDRTAAVRTLGACPACDPAAGSCCAADDEVCLRAVCPPATQLVLVRPDPVGATSIVRSLPAPPEAVAADRGGGFLVTMRCEPSGVAGGSECFPSDAADLCGGYLTAPGDENGALVLVAEDGSGLACLAVQPALAGPVAVTPNGAEAWASGTTAAGQFLLRLALPRRTSDGAIDATRRADLVAFETLHASPLASGAPPPGGVAFTPEGGTGILTVPAQFRILLRE